MVLLAATALTLVLIALDLTRKLPIINPVVLAIYLPVAVNAPLVSALTFAQLGPSWVWTLILTGVPSLYLWLRLNAVPIMDEVPVGFRVKALGGARPLLYALTYAVTVCAVALPLSFVFRSEFTRLGSTVSTEVLVVNTTYALGCCLVLYLNAVIRAVVCSRSLGVIIRWLLFSVSWVPLLGLPVCLAAGRQVRREYLAAVDRVEWERAMPEDDRCATRYPVVLVHGVGWRDVPAFNAWGRIPRYLKRHGASVHHGGQDAWGSIEDNGRRLAERVERVLAETGASKVNLIAHSRGGIDARYAVSRLGLGDRVASLTTMNTPHHGVRFTDTATKMHEPIYRRLAAAVNWLFRTYGDATPDFFASTMAFRTETSAEFNANTPDDPRVYYQSYTSVMSRPSSNRLLSVSYRIIKALGEDNDGLVSVDSAKWGNFRGVFASTTHRGIGHGDLVDMNRADYTGFNVLDAYITIVADLKNRGF